MRTVGRVRTLARDERDRRILALVLPALGTLAAEPLYVLADTAIVGHLGTAPLAGLALAASVLLLITIILGAVQVILRLLFPQLAPSGTTTLILAILFFGSINLFAVGLVGEYIAKIFEEVKQRPHFIRRSLIRDGEIRAASSEAQSAKI